ncbi:hypothetical protein AAFF_G00396520 [Aldrovandia affinis]|uniref:Uncharacterized protein n=1 Tax=Aldrovandia affinis TaxID=143900 RepID=A0AAD7WKT5_9TELE|nr:hypothetical protein AAFF_G00396520 [Aldrovandia affinis]
MNLLAWGPPPFTSATWFSVHGHATSRFASVTVLTGNGLRSLRPISGADDRLRGRVFGGTGVIKWSAAVCPAGPACSSCSVPAWERQAHRNISIISPSYTLTPWLHRAAPNRGCALSRHRSFPRLLPLFSTTVLCGGVTFT